MGGMSDYSINGRAEISRLRIKKGEFTHKVDLGLFKSGVL